MSNRVQYLDVWVQNYPKNTKEAKQWKQKPFWDQHPPTKSLTSSLKMTWQKNKSTFGPIEGQKQIGTKQLHQIGGHGATVTAHPKADVFAIHLVTKIILKTWQHCNRHRTGLWHRKHLKGTENTLKVGVWQWMTCGCLIRLDDDVSGVASPAKFNQCR